jgi:alpha-tubulin suppressor-like RCC1 family protein
VAAVGWNEYGQCNVRDWRDIVAVAAGCAHTIGLKSDGTMIAVGDNEYGQCDVSSWANIQLPGN